MAKKKIPEQTKSTPVENAQWEEVQRVRRINSVADMRELYSKFVLENTKRCSTFVECRGLIEGNRPYNQATLDGQGLGWQANCNTGDARAMLEKAQKPYHTLVESQPNRLSFTIHENTPHRQKFEAAFAKNFDRFIDDWGSGYKKQWQIISDSHIQFGLGMGMWPFKGSPRFSAANVERILFPKDAQISPDDWDVVFVTRDVPISELYMKIKDKKAMESAGEIGWNIKAVQKALYYNLYGNQRRDGRDYTRVADYIVNNDVVISGKFQPLQLIYAYVRGFDGKIAHYICTIDGSLNEFLFENDAYEDRWQSIFGPVWYDVGRDGLAHSVKGFLVKNYYLIVATQRLKLRLIDSATLSLALNLKWGDTTPSDSPPIANFGCINVLPQGLEPIPTYPQLQQGASILEMLTQNQAENNSLYRQQNQNQLAKAPTLGQAQLLASQTGQLTESQASLFLAQVGESIFSECVRRLRQKGNTDPDAKAFVRRMREDGVPDKVIFDSEIRVQCAASAGIASALMREQRSQQMLGLANMPGINQRYWLEQYIAYAWGSAAVDKGMIPDGQNSMPYERKIAKGENFDLGQGADIDADSNEAHFEHLQTHLHPLAQIAGQFQQSQQITPEQQVALGMGIRHCAQHIEFLKQDATAKEKYQQVWPIFSQISSVARAVMKQAADAQQEQAQMQGGMPQSGPPMPMQAPGQGM